MNRTRICPKCGSNEIYVIDGYTGPYGSGNNVMIGATVFSAVKVNRYICCTCGFTEEDSPALVGAMFHGDLVVDNNIDASAADFATVITVNDLGNIK